MFVQVPVHTVSPRWFSDTDSNTKNAISPRSEMALTVVVVVISSPATTGGPQTNSWAPWTIMAKLMPTSGSNRAGATDRLAYTTANIGGATRSA